MIGDILTGERICFAAFGVASVDIGLAADVHNQGYGTEAMRLIIDFAFDELSLHRVQLSVYS